MLPRRMLVGVAACGLLIALPSTAQARVLSKSRAQSAATAAAKRLARRRPGDASRPRYTRPVCRRRSRSRFVCTTTIRGTAACDPSEPVCDGPAPWELSYVITVRFRSATSSRLRVTTAEA